MKFQFIDAQSASYPVRFLCSFMGVSCSGYYAWKQRCASKRQQEGMVLLAHIKEVFATSRQTYGDPRIHAELKEVGIAVGRKRVARLMRDNALRAIRKPHIKKITDSSHNNSFAPKLLELDFTCTGENQKWGVDISFLWTTEGWLYLAIVLDLYSRRIVGWATSKRMTAKLSWCGALSFNRENRLKERLAFTLTDLIIR